MVGYADIVYTRHAREKMAERSIPEPLVADVLALPDRIYANGDVMVAERVLNDGKPWRVVFVEEDVSPHRSARVVSVYRIDKLKAP